jgi:hypothetical protein
MTLPVCEHLAISERDQARGTTPPGARQRARGAGCHKSFPRLQLEGELFLLTSPFIERQKAEKVRSEIRLAVAVGTIIAGRPPHRSVRARLRIRLPPRMSGVKTLHGIRMENASDWNPSVDEPVEPVHADIAALAAPR